MKKRARENEKFPSKLEIEGSPELMAEVKKRTLEGCPKLTFRQGQLFMDIAQSRFGPDGHDVNIDVHYRWHRKDVLEKAIHRIPIVLAYGLGYVETVRHVHIDIKADINSTVPDLKDLNGYPTDAHGPILDTITDTTALLVALHDIGIPKHKISFKMEYECEDTKWMGHLESVATTVAGLVRALGVADRSVCYSVEEDDIAAKFRNASARSDWPIELCSAEYLFGTGDDVVTTASVSLSMHLISSIETFLDLHEIGAGLNVLNITDLTVRVGCESIKWIAALTELPNLETLRLVVGTPVAEPDAETDEDEEYNQLVCTTRIRDSGATFNSLTQLEYDCVAACCDTCLSGDRIFEWIVSRARHITQLSVSLPTRANITVPSPDAWYSRSALFGMFLDVKDHVFNYHFPPMLPSVMALTVYDSYGLLYDSDAGTTTSAYGFASKEDSGYALLFRKLKSLITINVHGADVKHQGRCYAREAWMGVSFTTAFFRAINMPPAMTSFTEIIGAKRLFYDLIYPLVAGPRLVW